MIKLKFYLFYIFLFMTGFYYIPDINISDSIIISGISNDGNLTLIKRFFYSLLCIIFLLNINWKKLKFDFFFMAVSFWCLSHIITYLFNPTDMMLYLERGFQIGFIFLFVTYIRQKDDIFFAEAIACFPYQTTSILFIFIFLLSYIDPLWCEAIFNGFAGQRVNFSIWITQILFCMLLVSSFKNNNKNNFTEKYFFKLLLFICPVFLVQLITSGRTGILGSILLMLFFTWYYYREFKFIIYIISFISILITTIFFFSPFKTVQNKANLAQVSNGITGEITDANMLRNLLQGDSTFIETFVEIVTFKKKLDYFDKLSSDRLKLMYYGVIKAKKINPFVGLGIGQFTLSHEDGYNVGYGKRVHNTFLNHYGEVGVLSLIALILLYISFLINYRHFNNLDKFMAISFIIFTIFPILQPVFLFSQVSTSLIIWACFGRFLRDNLKNNRYTK